eukprot:COSAG02_NODE_8312_length_2620_cov_7.600952_4_plen_251_part_00
MGSPLLLPLLLVGRTVAQQGAPTNHIHHSPPCARGGGWHDIAGALSLGERDHHIWQGCGSGWGYSWSPDLVRWQFVDIAPHAVPETYEGMASDSTPCSGFATLDDAGRLCAGFRQCSSTHGTTGLNPAAAVWDVPLELRCANTSSRIGNERRAGPPILEWSAPQYLYNPYYHTNPLPYDPPRPWREGAEREWLRLAQPPFRTRLQRHTTWWELSIQLHHRYLLQWPDVCLHSWWAARYVGSASANWALVS